jgi:Zn-dependent protease with chaperone function
MMSEAERRALVARLETFAQRAPKAYRMRLALLAALGFCVLGGAVALALGLSAGLIALLLVISPLLLVKLAKVVWIPIGFGWLVLRALWVRFEPPPGRPLAPGEAPRLVAEVERLRRAAGAPRLSGILIDDDLNAAAASVPRVLGLLGHRHYLVLGLPLMQLLDPAQFASVIAHEFGHFGGGHGRFSGWIHRVRLSWYRVLDGLAARGAWASRVFERFFRWYAPYFDAYSFVLARQNEYQADAMAARLAGADVAGSALIRVNVGAARLEHDFWPSVIDANRERAEPPDRLLRDMATALRSPHPQDDARLAVQLTARAGVHDTHPTLVQRLQALGVAAMVAPPPERSAAEVLLGDLLPSLEAAFSEDWRLRIGDGWRERYRAHADDCDRLAALESGSVRTPAETVEYAALVERVRPQDDPVPLYREAVRLAPQDAFAHFRLGALLLERDMPAGVGLLHHARMLDPSAADAVNTALAAYYRRRDDLDALDAVIDDQVSIADRRRGAQQARNALSAGDALLPHRLDAAALAAARASLAATGKIGSAWIVRKHIEGDADGLPHFLVLVRWRGLVLDTDATLQRVVDALELPGSCIVFTASGRRWIAGRVRKVAGLPTYRHGVG